MSLYPSSDDTICASPAWPVLAISSGKKSDVDRVKPILQVYCVTLNTRSCVTFQRQLRMMASAVMFSTNGSRSYRALSKCMYDMWTLFNDSLSSWQVLECSTSRGMHSETTTTLKGYFDSEVCSTKDPSLIMSDQPVKSRPTSTIHDQSVGTIGPCSCTKAPCRLRTLPMTASCDWESGICLHCGQLFHACHC
ncbi:hypothetical protein GY45DRAFT_263108 [Cubamyces sp. BRFM 1775]|nr:hypothetical protein GY45DRAFT_263108 [Cubamyces sp. BRFM 1775]